MSDYKTDHQHLTTHTTTTTSRHQQMLPYQHDMARRIEEADTAHTQGKHTVCAGASRQLVSDLLEADRMLRQTNPWNRAIGKRLRLFAAELVAELEKAEDKLARGV